MFKRPLNYCEVLCTTQYYNFPLVPISHVYFPRVVTRISERVPHEGARGRGGEEPVSDAASVMQIALERACPRWTCWTTRARSVGARASRRARPPCASRRAPSPRSSWPSAASTSTRTDSTCRAGCGGPTPTRTPSERAASAEWVSRSTLYLSIEITITCVLIFISVYEWINFT